MDPVHIGPSSPVPIADGGTGQTTATAGFGALSPTTTRGDLIRRGAAANERVALGAAGTVLGSDGTDAVWRTLSALLDAVFGSTRGMILRRTATAWEALSKGSNRQILSADANDVLYQSIISLMDAFGDTQGYILFRNSGGWDVLPPGTAGQLLQTGGAGANPSWATAGGGVPTASAWGTDERDADTTLVAGDDVLQVFKPTAPRTCKLPVPSTSVRWFLIVHAGANDAFTVRIQESTGLDLGLILAPGDAAWCLCDSGQYFVLPWTATYTSRRLAGYQVVAYGGDPTANDTVLQINEQANQAAVALADNVIAQHRATGACVVDRVSVAVEAGTGDEQWGVWVNGSQTDTLDMDDPTAYGGYFVQTFDLGREVAAGDRIQVGRVSQAADIGDVKVYLWLRHSSSSGHGYSLSWGGDAGAVDRYYLPIGRPDAEVPVATRDYTSEHLVTHATTDVTLAWDTQSGDSTTVVKITVDDVVTETVQLTGASGTYPLSGDSYAAGVKVTIEYDAGTDPNDSTFAIEFATVGLVPLIFQGDPTSDNVYLNAFLGNIQNTGSTTSTYNHGVPVPYRVQLARYGFNGASTTSAGAKVRVNGVVDTAITPAAVEEVGDLSESADVFPGDVIEVSADSSAGPAMRWQILCKVVSE